MIVQVIKRLTACYPASLFSHPSLSHLSNVWQIVSAESMLSVLPRSECRVQRNTGTSQQQDDL